jgi:putative spermidine/putrescine transport system ATP-binding protein
VSAGDFSVAGRVTDVVYLGAATRYVVELVAGLELAVVEQNFDKTASTVLAAKGQQVQLNWPVDAPRAVSTEGETGSNEPTATEVGGNA